MIARLRGEILEKGADGIVVETGGVGYAVHVSLQTMSRLAGVGESVELVIHTHVREEALQLFGFVDARERELFLRLTQVSGIGPRLALTVLSGLSGSELTAAIREGDVPRLTSIPGIGKRMAERMVVELRDKLGPLADASPAAAVATALDEEAVSAMVNLGYKRVEAERAVQAAARGGASTFEDLVREALRGVRA